MKVAALSLALVIAGVDAHGDQLLLMPTARRLPTGEFRAEGWANGRLSGGALTAGLIQAWEGQVSIDRFGGDPGRPTGSLAYYYLSPIADITPGISGGLLDAANTTNDGRRVYACATMNRSLPRLARLGYVELTAGVEVGRRSGPLAGAKAPLARGFSALAEYDGFRFNAGLEGRLGSGAYVRLATRGGVPFVVLGFRS